MHYKIYCGIRRDIGVVNELLLHLITYHTIPSVTKGGVKSCIIRFIAVLDVTLGVVNDINLLVGLPWRDRLSGPGVRHDAGERTIVVCLIAGHAKHSSFSSMASRRYARGMQAHS